MTDFPWLAVLVTIVLVCTAVLMASLVITESAYDAHVQLLLRTVR